MWTGGHVSLRVVKVTLVDLEPLASFSASVELEAGCLVLV
jgi:hypothetical protein